MDSIADQTVPEAPTQSAGYAQFTCDLALFKAANIFASDDSTRYYLQGVAVWLANGKLTLVATDGHRLVKIVRDLPDAIGCLAGAIIPATVIDALKADRKLPHVTVTVTGTEVTFDQYDRKQSGKLIDGTYPDYERIMPDPKKSKPCDLIGFNPAYMGDFAKLHTTLGRKGAGVSLRMGEDYNAPMIVQMADNAEAYTGVLMPLRLNRGE